VLGIGKLPRNLCPTVSLWASFLSDRASSPLPPASFYLSSFPSCSNEKVGEILSVRGIRKNRSAETGKIAREMDRRKRVEEKKLVIKDVSTCWIISRLALLKDLVAKNFTVHLAIIHEPNEFASEISFWHFSLFSHRIIYDFILLRWQIYVNMHRSNLPNVYLDFFINLQVIYKVEIVLKFIFDGLHRI